MICQNANRADQTSLSAFKPPAIKRKIVKFVPVIRTGSCRFTWSNFCLSSAVVRRRPESLRPWWFDEQDKLLRWSVAFYLWDWSRSVLLEQNKRATKQIETWLLEKSTNEKRTKSANLGQSLLELQIEIEWNERWDHIANFGMDLRQHIGWIHRHPQYRLVASDINGMLCCVAKAMSTAWSGPEILTCWTLDCAESEREEWDGQVMLLIIMNAAKEG